jgi:hypothetical protein
VHSDLRKLVDSAKWFATIILPLPTRFDNSAHRFEVEWKNARRKLSERWTDDELALVEALVGGLSYDGGEALMLVLGQHGVTLAEFHDEPVPQLVVHEGSVPRLAMILEARQREIPHIVVETDRAGADITAFHGEEVLVTEQVQGETLHIHRGPFGGWAQHRYKRRAESVWERNGDDVAEVVAALAREVGARLIVIAGDVRAQGFVLAALPSDLASIAVTIDEGSPDGIADHVRRLRANVVAEKLTELAERLRTGLAEGVASVDAHEILEAAAEGRIDTLLVHDDDLDLPTTARTIADIPTGTRVIDAAIVAALRTDAEIFVVPNLAAMSGPVAAIFRW